MPGNEGGDRVHNFFAQDNSSQGQHQSHVLEGNWPVPNSRQIDVLNPSSKIYLAQNSEIERGQVRYPVHESHHGVNFSQSNLKPNISKSQYKNEQQYSNVVYGNQLHQNRQNEANFLTMDTDSNHRHQISSRSSSIQEAQRGSSHEQREEAFDKLKTSVAPVSFDLFGGQPQVNHQQASMLHALQRQQSALNEMQQMQQQFMIRKMQESQIQHQESQIQQQEQLRKLDLRPQDLANQVQPFSKQTPGSMSSNLINGFSNSDFSEYPWMAEPCTNWMNHSSSAKQGFPSGLGIPPNLSQTHHLMDLVPQQADQSLYGVSVSSSRGLAVNQYPQTVTDRSSMPQASTFSNHLHGGQHNFLPNQIGGQEFASISGLKSQNENIGHASGQSLNTRMADRPPLPQMNLKQMNAPQLHIAGRQELATQSDTSNENSTRQVSSSPNEVALDPTEEKILFGSDDNLWSAFGKSYNMSGEASNLFDNDGLSNGFPSFQSGRWSALMQSAVAETSSAGMGPQEEWSGLNLHNADDPSANQHALLHNDYVKNTCLANDDLQISSASNSGSIHSSEDINTANVMGSNQHGHKFQNEPSISVSTDTSQRFRQSLDEANKWSNRSPLQKSISQRSQIYGNTPQHTLDPEKRAEKVSATWVSGKTGNKLEQNGWSNLAAGPSDGDRVSDNHEDELSKKSPNSQLIEMQGGLPGSSLWKSNSVSNSTNERLSLNVASASVPNSCNTRVGDGTSSFIQNNNLPQWNSAHPPTKFHESEVWGGVQDQVNEYRKGLDSLSRGDKDEVRRHDVEICTLKENSNDSDRSNFLQHASNRFREAGLSGTSDSWSLPSGKQKLTNQIAGKVSVPRKFQYHPLGNLDEDMEPTIGMKQPTPSSMQNSRFGQSSQVSRYYAVKDKGELPKDIKGTNEEPTRSRFPGSASRMDFPFNRPLDSNVPNKASSPSQNMLELLHKVDQSRNDGDVLHPRTDCSLSSQQPEAENSDESSGHIQRGQSFVSKGCGLQLGPPSQRLHIPDSQNARDTPNSVHASHAGAEMREKMLQTSSERSFSFPNEGSQCQNDRTSGSGYPGDDNSLYKAYGSDTLCARSQLQNKQITKGIEKMPVDEQIDPTFSGNTSHSAQRGSVEAVQLDASLNIRKNNLASYGGMPGASDLQRRSPSATASTRDHINSSQHFGVPSISGQGGSRQISQGMWSNAPSSQHPLAAQYLKDPSHLSVQPQPSILESSIHGNLHVNKGGHLSSELNATHVNSRVVDEETSFVDVDLTSKVDGSLGKGSSIKDTLDDSPANSASTQKDIEAFGRSLKSDAFSNKNSALPNQMKASIDAQTDPSIRASKRIKGLDNIFDVHHLHLKTGQQNEDGVGDVLASNAGVSCEDSRMFNLSSPSDIMQRNTSPHGNIGSHDIVVAGLDASQNNSSHFTTSVKNHQVAPQMAPSWLNRYGPFTKGQFLPVYDSHKVSLRPDEPPSTPLKSPSSLDAPNLEQNSTAAPIGAGQVSCSLDFTPTSVSIDYLSSAHSLQVDVTGQHQVILRPQKRKTATSELNPWNKEISDGSQNILVLSVAEEGWSKAANCLSKKVQGDADLIEDGSPLLRSNRRLILTTQLMQQLFFPPPMAILYADDSSTYESVTYDVSRVALRGVCSAVARSSDLRHRDCLDQHFMKGKLHGDPRFGKVIEELLGKARKLEADFLRLDKSASILDLRVESQDLEKFSGINRFVRLHGRGQPDISEASRSAHVQRYATAVAVPKNFPDRVQCLSL